MNFPWDKISHNVQIEGYLREFSKKYDTDANKKTGFDRQDETLANQRGKQGQLAQNYKFQFNYPRAASHHGFRQFYDDLRHISTPGLARLGISTAHSSKTHLAPCSPYK